MFWGGLGGAGCPHRGWQCWLQQLALRGSLRGERGSAGVRGSSGCSVRLSWCFLPEDLRFQPVLGMGSTWRGWMEELQG